MADVVAFAPRRKPAAQAKRAFAPLTGNPENGDYLDYLRHLREQSLGECQPIEASVVPLSRPSGKTGPA